MYFENIWKSSMLIYINFGKYMYYFFWWHLSITRSLSLLENHTVSAGIWFDYSQWMFWMVTDCCPLLLVLLPIILFRTISSSLYWSHLVLVEVALLKLIIRWSMVFFFFFWWLENYFPELVAVAVYIKHCRKLLFVRKNYVHDTASQLLYISSVGLHVPILCI